MFEYALISKSNRSQLELWSWPDVSLVFKGLISTFGSCTNVMLQHWWKYMWAEASSFTLHQNIVIIMWMKNWIPTCFCQWQYICVCIIRYLHCALSCITYNLQTCHRQKCIATALYVYCEKHIFWKSIIVQ